MLSSCCLLGHVDFAFSYVFLGTHVSSRRSALKITKYCSHSTYTRTYTLGLCVQSSRDALHKQTLAAITNLQESQGAFAALCSKAPQPSQGKSCSLTIPLSFWDSHGYGSSCLLRTGIRLSTTLVATPLLGGPRSKVGSFPATQLACNSAFPHRGASKRMDNFALLLPSPPKHLSC